MEFGENPWYSGGTTQNYIQVSILFEYINCKFYEFKLWSVSHRFYSCSTCNILVSVMTRPDSNFTTGPFLIENIDILVQKVYFPKGNDGMRLRWIRNFYLVYHGSGPFRIRCAIHAKFRNTGSITLHTTCMYIIFTSITFIITIFVQPI